MRRGPNIDISIPERFNLAAYYLDENVAQGRGELVAVCCQDEKCTYSDMIALTNRMGNVLKELGVGFGDRVLLVLQDSPEWIAGWYAAMKIGSIPSHAYTYLLSSDYEYFINYVQPKVVIVDTTTLERVRDGARTSKCPPSILVARDGLSDHLEERELLLQPLLKKASPILETAPTSKNDIACWNFSGGTTGKSKGVPHRHQDGVFGFESYQYTAKYAPGDVVFRVPKLFFHYSRDLGMNWAIKAGATVVLHPERSTVESVFQYIAKYRPTVLINVPTMMRSMLQHPMAEEADFSCIRLCISSGELLSAPLYREFTKRFNVEVLNTVGSAECALGYFMDYPGQVMPGSSGKVQPLVEVKLVGEDGEEVPTGETARLHVRSEASGFCYHQEEEKTRKTFVGNGWVNTNDLFREDEDGHFWYMGRADDLIKVSGVYVSPLEIEKCLDEHEAIRECVVLGMKDADGLLKLKAFVVLNDGFEPSEAMGESLKGYCRQKMAPFKAPRSIEFVPEFPKTGQGKIDKRQIMATYNTH
jgi:benzoate-CoA ligase family protein